MVSRFTASVEINRPAAALYDLFLDKANFKNWKKDFLGYEHVSGTPAHTGAVTKLKYKRQTMTETITSLTPPSEVLAAYEHQQGGKTNMYVSVINRFTALSAEKTLLEVESTVTQVNGFIMRILIKLMSGAGKSYAQTQLDQLKILAEKRAS